MSELKYYDVTVNGRRQAVYLKGDVDEYVDQLEEENESLRVAMRNTIYANKTTSKCNMKYLHRALLAQEPE